MRVLTGTGHSYHAYTLTGPEALTLDDVATVLSAVLERRIAYRNPGIPAFLRHTRAAGHPLAFGLVWPASIPPRGLGWHPASNLTWSG